MAELNKLADFVAWYQAHVTGDEKSEAHAHWLWFVTKCGKLKSDFCYTAKSVFDTFPWPQFPVGTAVPAVRAGGPGGSLGTASPTNDMVAKINAVAAAGREVRRIRAEALTKLKGGLRALYRTLELPGSNPLKDAHAALDAAVLTAYGFDPKQDLLTQLLALNLEVAGKIEAGEKVTAPGIPAGYLQAAKLVTSDCIRPMP